MPEIAEVERAARLLRSVALHRRIERVTTSQDVRVFSPPDLHMHLPTFLEQSTVTNVQRYGKYFYLQTDRKSCLVMHLGMSGAVQIKGNPAAYYRRYPKGADATTWPPLYYKFCLKFAGSDNDFAMVDPRRLGKIRLLEQVTDPLTVEPFTKLGFDPILSMPALPDFTALVRVRKCPIKALLLNQAVFAGVGNWVADEILYHARIHPEQYAHTLTDDQMKALYDKTLYVCQKAVAVNANHHEFPPFWLFSYRWGKGKDTSWRKDKKEEEEEEEEEEQGAPKKKQKVSAVRQMTLEDGRLGTLKWMTVGGRTSAIVEEVQILPSSLDVSTKDEDKESTLPTESVDEPKVKKTTKRVKVEASSTMVTEERPAKRPTRRSQKTT